MRGIEHIPWLYDALMSPMDTLGFRRWRKALVQGTQAQTLEVGCGTGRNLPLYAEWAPEAQVIALDPDLDALRRARQRCPDIPLVVARAESLPFRDQQFQTVVSALVFCSVSDPAAGFAEIRRVLNPEGELRMIEHVRHHRPFLAKVQDWLQPPWTWLTGGCHPNRDTEATLQAAGFHVDAQQRVARGVMRSLTAYPAGHPTPCQFEGWGAKPSALHGIRR